MNDPIPTETLPSIQGSVRSLKDRLGAELARVREIPTVTPEQQQELADLVTDMGKQLDKAEADSATSADLATTWSDWVSEVIIPKLTALSDKFKAFAAVPEGCCFYSGTSFPSTQAACSLPGSTWTQAPCP